MVLARVSKMLPLGFIPPKEPSKKGKMRVC
jgi:hypothetical protein